MCFNFEGFVLQALTFLNYQMMVLDEKVEDSKTTHNCVDQISHQDKIKSFNSC